MTAVLHIQGVGFTRQHAKSVLTPALMISLVAHAAIGGIAFQNWQRAAVEQDPPFTVKLETVTPTIVEAPPSPAVKQPPAPAKHTQVNAPRAPIAPAPALIAVERVDVTPASVVAPAVEAPPAPIVVAKAPVALNSPQNMPIELPHFDVAYLNNPRPAYPAMARKLGIEGVVLLRVDVSARGTPEKIVVAQTSGASMLDEAAMKAVQGWTFVPARRGDAAIAHPVEVPIRFQLKN